MDIFLLIIAFLCLLIAIIGCVIPGIPGVPVAYLGLLLAELTDKVDFSWEYLLIWAFIVIVVSVLDFLTPAWGTKQFGGTKLGVWGSTIGLIVGLFFGAIGVIIGPLIGAILGEMLVGKKLVEAFKAGWGSFIGIFCGTLLKLICCGIMTINLIQALV